MAVVMTLDVHVAAAAVETAEAEARHAAAEAAENQLWVAAQEQRIASRPARARAFAAKWAEGEAADREAMQAEVQLAAAAVETAEAEALETARLAAAAKEWNQLCVAAEVARRARARDSQRVVRAAWARRPRDRAEQRHRRRCVRRLAARAGFGVEALHRKAMGALCIDDLPVGAVRCLTPLEVETLLHACGLEKKRGPPRKLPVAAAPELTRADVEAALDDLVRRHPS